MNGVLRERLMAANATLAKLTAAQPGNDTNAVGATNGNQDNDTSPQAAAARFDRTFGSMNAG